MRLSSLRPSYFFRRLAQIKFEREQPGAPWLTRSAVLLLESYLRPTDVGFEWGSGRSTVWLARHVGHLTSVEDHAQWHADVTARLARQGVAAKVNYRLVPCEHQEIDEPASHPYADAVGSVPDESLDFALVDGNIRLTCFRAALPKLKPGGLLILDNANRYVPNFYGARSTTVHQPLAEPFSPGWAQALDGLRDWRWIHTSDGIWDTRFWIKPSQAA